MKKSHTKSHFEIIDLRDKISKNLTNYTNNPPPHWSTTLFDLPARLDIFLNKKNYANFISSKEIKNNFDKTIHSFDNEFKEFDLILSIQG